MLNLAIKYALEFLGANKITLGVFENNPSELWCIKQWDFKKLKQKILSIIIYLIRSGEILKCNMNNNVLPMAKSLYFWGNDLMTGENQWIIISRSILNFAP